MYVKKIFKEASTEGQKKEAVSYHKGETEAVCPWKPMEKNASIWLIWKLHFTEE